MKERKNTCNKYAEEAKRERNFDRLEEWPIDSQNTFQEKS